jgi:hypothetical protein
VTTDEPLGKLILFVAAVLAFITTLFIDAGGNWTETLEWARDNETRAYIGTLIDLASVPFLLAGVIVYWLSTRAVRPALALLASVSLTVGYVSLAALDGSQALAFSLVGDPGVDLPGLAKTLDDDWLPLVLKATEFGGWLVGILAALGGLGISPWSRVSALALLSVPFVARIPELGGAGPAVVVVAASAVLWGEPFVRSRFGPD